MTDKILSQMAMFDFSAPVKTVMVFEDDSDDENYFSPPKKLKSNKLITRDNLHNRVDIVSSSDEDIHLQNNIKIKNVTEKENNKDGSTDHYRGKNCHCKPKPTNLQVSKPNEQAIPKSHTLQKEKNIVSASNVDDKCSKLQSLHSEIVNNEKVSEEIIPEQVNKVTSLNNSSQSNDIEIMSGYLKKLINSVSEHLLMILEAYRLYINVQNTGNQTFIERSRIHYFQVKHHFFKLSFLIVESIFIPQVHSYTFARNFIECTARIGKRKSMKYSSYEQIEPLYLEMLEWTKTKAKEFNKISLSYMTSKWHMMSQANKTSTDSTKQNVPNLNPQNLKTLPRNKNLNTTSGLQRVECASNQLHPQYSQLKSSLISPTLPSYEDATNLQRNSIVELNKIVYGNCQPHNNYETTHHHHHHPLSSVTNSVGSYDFNNLSNAHLRGTTCLSNGLCVLQNCAHCRQIQFNSGISQQTATIPNISPATTLDPNIYGCN